ncbi:unnamed protein product [Arabidopsis arenosa]|uniref:Fatty acyl-CoA reductase n=1 Tax=Arabidopsis arenosa TaxID=38785 RepID=A0A8S2AFN9_ARAAE|nr:unnamed protein product [Arabidopsis arenosa]
MDSGTSLKISEEIDIIISSAARTTFADRCNSALSVKALGPGRLLIFAKMLFSENPRPRAQIHGWENTYTFTKAMGETVIRSNRGELPVVIIRPSIIESSYNEPFPVWIQGFRIADPVILAYGKRQLPGF